MSLKKFTTSSMIKDAVDNFPGGLCFFDNRGIPILVNRTMQKLVFTLTGHDIQDISDLDNVMEKPSEITLNDGTIWQFSKRIADDRNGLIEITASDITELTKQKEKLQEGNEEQREVMEHLEQISKDVVGITRNEEILAMKMRIHSELGFALSETRHFITSGCLREEKSGYIKNQREMARKLLVQIDIDDEPDIFEELKKSAEKLGLEIVCEGEIPDDLEETMTKVIRECLINVIRHGDGDKVFVKCFNEDDRFVATIQDNGHSENTENITEGGGLKSIRRYIEERGGCLTVDVKPEFTVTVIFIKGDISI